MENLMSCCYQHIRTSNPIPNPALTVGANPLPPLYKNKRGNGNYGN